jgi:hypothetical protein
MKIWIPRARERKRKAREKTSNSKLHHPEKFQSSSFRVSLPQLWRLVFEVSLEFDAWSLEFLAARPGTFSGHIFAAQSSG